MRFLSLIRAGSKGHTHRRGLSAGALPPTRSNAGARAIA